MKITPLCFILFILSLVNVVFAQQLPATMEEGETRIFALGERNYEVEVLIIENTNPPTVFFKVNGENTGDLTEGASKELSDGIVLDVIDIMRDEWTGLDTVTFTFRNYCGDRQCNSNENCNICQADCGCQEDYACDQGTNRCRQVNCGDNKCDPNEECVQDSCCYGKIVDLKTDIRHCGACTKQCSYKEGCSQGTCAREGQQNITASNISCGDRICQQNEKNCCSDCGCKEGYSCVEEVCVRNACASTDDCNDHNPCTTDTCTGTPKTCVHKDQDGCSIEEECVQQTNSISINNVSSFCNVKNEWEKQRADGAQCDEGYECLGEKCQSNTCYTEKSKGVIQRLLQWLKKLFTN